MKNMRSSVLQMKLNELENQINKAFREPDSPIINNQHIHADIEQRLTFVKKLLSAEMASDPDPAKQSYLLENMWERVRELEAGYRGSGTGSSTTISTIDHVDNVGDDDDDYASNCSCPETLLHEDDVSDDLESTLGHDTGVCVDLIEEKKTMPVMVFNNVLFEGKVGDDNDGVEDEFRDHVENVLLLDNMSRNGASVEDEQEEKEEMEEKNKDEEEMEEKQIRAYVDLKKMSEKKKKGLGFGKFCAAVSGFVIGMFSMAFIISLEDEDYEGHGRFLAPT